MDSPGKLVIERPSTPAAEYASSAFSIPSEELELDTVDTEEQAAPTIVSSLQPESPSLASFRRHEKCDYCQEANAQLLVRVSRFSGPVLL